MREPRFRLLVVYEGMRQSPVRGSEHSSKVLRSLDVGMRVCLC